MKVPNTGLVPEESKALFREEGYMVLEKALSERTLQMLREECSYFLGYFDAQLDLGDGAESLLTHRGKRYFIHSRYRFSQRLWRFIFGETMAEICHQLLGENVILFHEQWVVKGAEQGMKFAWHQDSGYVKAMDPDTAHPPYLTCWCALDDVDEENGTVYLLPHSRGGTKGHIHTHDQEQGSNDLIGYRGDDPGIAITAPAGSVVCFSSYNLHRSGPNLGGEMRRVYLPQYASDTVVFSQSGERMNMNVPFIESGKIVYDHAADKAERWGGFPVPSSAAKQIRQRP